MWGGTLARTGRFVQPESQQKRDNFHHGYVQTLRPACRDDTLQPLQIVPVDLYWRVA